MRSITSVFLALMVVYTASARDLEIPGIFPNEANQNQQLGLYNPGSNASASFLGSFFEKVFDDLIPIIESVGKSITIPGQSAKHYSFGSFSLSKLTIGSSTVAFQAPSTVVLGLNDLSIDVPKTHFSVFTHIFGGEDDFKISCSGDFWGGISGTSITLNLDVVTTPEGQLHVASVTPSINFGTVNINHKLNNFFCKVGQDIIQLFIGNLNKFIAKKAEEMLPGKIASTLQNAANNALPKLPLTFVTQPAVEKDTLTVDVSILKPFYGDHGWKLNVSPTRSASGLGFAVFTDRDIAIGFNTQSFNDLVAVGTEMGLIHFNKTVSDYNTSVLEGLLPAIYKLCPGCPFQAQVAVAKTNPPTGLFYDDSMTFTFNDVIFGINAQNNATGQFAPLLDLAMNLSFSLTNFTVKNVGADSNITFNLALADFSLAVVDLPFPGAKVDLKTFSTILQDILKAWVVPEFNANFKGFPIHVAKAGFSLKDWVIKISSKDAVTLGANIGLPPF